MPPRHIRPPVASRGPVAPVHRGPQAAALSASGGAFHAPNAALLIDFDNVTMGIRSDLNAELRSLLSSDIVNGKVSVQRAYADWRRYPQYIVPLSESSIDLIFAPAYGSSKKNATDIRLAIDALELVFTRPEIGTFILLSGDSDFSSLVIKLKEYGKYVIGVGIRESSSDLLVQNCDEYYSYNALAGLVNTREEDVAKWDPWQLAGEAVQRMKRNGDVMRADRLKQVMQQIDSSFDEKNLGMSKFTRFVQEASHRGILVSRKMDNGQLEVDLPTGGAISATPADGATADAAPAASGDSPAAATPGSAPAREPREPRSRRGRGGRGRDRDRSREHGATPDANAAGVEPAADSPAAESRAPESPVAESPAAESHATREAPAQSELSFAEHEPRAARSARPAAPVPAPTPSEAGKVADGIGGGGLRLTRDEAFDLMRRAVDHIAKHGGGTRASDVRRTARELLGRDSESLNEKNFTRILKDAHDSDIIDLRRRGDDYEVRPAVVVAPIVDQLDAAAIANAPVRPPSAPAARGMGLRGAGSRSSRRGGAAAALPLDLLSVGVVDYDSPTTAAVATPVVVSAPTAPEAAPAAARRKPASGRKGASKKPASTTTAPTDSAASKAPAKTAAKTVAKPAAKSARKPAAKKTTTRK
ncbi:MAG: NYN domain-containing protein [Gemmatimonadaceae bacterium]